MALGNMYARVRGRIQGNGSQRDNIFKGDREEGKRTAGMHEAAVEMSGCPGGTRDVGFETATSQQTVSSSVIHSPAGVPFIIMWMNSSGGGSDQYFQMDFHDCNGSMLLGSKFSSVRWPRERPSFK